MEIKLKEKSKIIDIFIYLGFIIICAGGIIIKSINSLDEVWIFNFARCISNRTFAI